MLGFEALGHFTPGQITDNPIPVTLDKGDLTLTPQTIGIVRPVVLVAAQLTLTGQQIEIVVRGGASGAPAGGLRRRGMEPVKKRKPLPPDAPAPIPTPPTPRPKLPPEIMAPVEIITTVPNTVEMLEQQALNALDEADVRAFLSAIEQDEQDAADIAEVLALLD